MVRLARNRRLEGDQLDTDTKTNTVRVGKEGKVTGAIAGAHCDVAFYGDDGLRCKRNGNERSEWGQAHEMYTPEAIQCTLQPSSSLPEQPALKILDILECSASTRFEVVQHANLYRTSDPRLKNLSHTLYPSRCIQYGGLPYLTKQSYML